MRHNESDVYLEDIAVNTLTVDESAHAATFDTPVDWAEIEAANILINPDKVSMEARG